MYSDEEMIGLAWVDAPYRNIGTLFPNHREGKSILLVLVYTTDLLKRFEIVYFFYISDANKSHVASRVFVVWLIFYIFQKFPDEQDLHVLIDFITTNN